MKLGVRFLVMGAAISVLLLASGYRFITTFKTEPLLGQVKDFPSPDKRWVATVEAVDNGLGFGLGMLYDEVHIHHPDEKIENHGDDDRSTIFIANAVGESAKGPQIKWIDSTHLLITYDPARIEGSEPGKALKGFREIGINYHTESFK